jgi:hypothetical protein
MPRLPTDYSRTIIYKLCCLDQSINDIYIGHTTEFTKRKNSHKSDCNLNQKIKVYEFIRENGGWENWNMVQIEEYPCKNNREAESREAYWMKELNSTLNSRNSYRTLEERREQYKQADKKRKHNVNRIENVRNQKREYQKSDKRKEYVKQYRQTKALYLNELKCYNLKLE